MKNNGIFIFDVNTLISAFLIGSHANSEAFRKALVLGQVICTNSILRELTDVFLREKFDRYASLNDRLSILSKLENQLVVVTEPIISIYDCRDPKDNKYLELAISENATCIITGDKDLLVLNPFRKIPILAASDFLQIFG